MMTLGELTRVDLRAAWASEAQHFTPWLASEDGLKLLSDTLGIELALEAEEQPVGPFRADILAKRTDTPDDHWVLIENQLGKTDHPHLGQLLTYAAGLKAATIIWVAANFTDEHRAALDWLNEITSEHFEFYGLEVELWRIGSSPPAPKLNLVARPNDWSRGVQGSTDRDALASPLQKQQQRFWKGLYDLLKERKGPIRPSSPRPQAWAPYSIGRAEAWLAASVNVRKKYVGVELSFRGPPDKAWYKELEAQKAAIEAEVGTPLSWEPLEGKKQSRIGLYRQGSDSTDEARWPEQHAWLAERLETFHKVFAPRVKALSGFVNPPRDDEDAPEPA